MTDPISAYTWNQDLSFPASPSGGNSIVKPRTNPTASVEAATLTVGSQTSAALLDAARTASGVDARSVQTLRAAITADSYQVPPDQLATSILAALTAIKE